MKFFMSKMNMNHEKGFTLMEMLIVVTIIGILAAVIIPRFVTSSKQAKANAHRADRQQLNSQVELYFFVNGTYPSAMTNEGWGDTFTDYFPEGVPTGCNQGTAWTIAAGRIEVHAGH
jgi:general secretion pathway protein G